MNKLVKGLLSFSTCATLLFSTVNHVALAQDNVVEVVDVREAKEQGKYVVKVNLLGQEEEANKVLYYLTANNSDVSLAQITQSLVALGVQLEGDLAYVSLDSVNQTLATNVGELTVPVFELQAKALNLSAVEVPQSTEGAIVVTELEQVKPFKTLLLTVKFQEKDTQSFVAEYRLLGESYDADSVLNKAVKKFETEYENMYRYNVSEVTYPTAASTSDTVVFQTSVGEVEAVPVEVIIPVEKQAVVSTVESTTTSSESVTTESTTESKEDTSSVVSESTSASVSSESQSVTSEQSSQKVEESTKVVATKSSSLTTDKNKATNEKDKKSGLPQTGETSAFTYIIPAVLIGLVGLWLSTRKIKEQ